MDVGERIKLCRAKRDMSQEVLAEKVMSIRGGKLSRDTIRRWERGITSPSVKDVEAIAQALDISLEDLILPEARVDKNDKTKPVLINAMQSFRRLPGGLFALNSLVFVPKISVEYTAHCGGVGVAYGDVTDLDSLDFEVIAEQKLGPIDPYRPPFALSTDGTSMVDFGIPPDTTVIVNPAAEIKPGDIVLVEINGNPVIKKIYPRPGAGGKLLSSDGRALGYTEEDIEIEFVRVRGKIVKADLELDHRP